MDNQTSLLLVEDDPADARFVQEILRDASGVRFVVHRSDTLADGLQKLQRNPFDVILLDLGLPDSQGLATAEVILQAAPRVPLVILTGLADDEIGIEAVQRGAQDYLVKGHFDSRSLQRAIYYAIDRQNIVLVFQEQMAFQQQMIDALPIPIFYMDHSLSVIGCNLEFESLTGQHRFGLFGRNFKEVIPTDMAESFEELAAEGALQKVSTVVDAHGVTRRLVMKQSPIRDRDGQAAGLVVMFFPEEILDYRSR